MTPEQEKQFNDFACVPRSIIKYTEIINKPITKEEFCKRFDKYFPSNQYGLLHLDKFCLVVTELGLCDNVTSTSNSHFAIEALRAKQAVFANTCFELDYALNVSSTLNHCRLFVDVRGSAIQAMPVFYLWSPYQDGTDETVSISLERLNKEGVHYWILS